MRKEILILLIGTLLVLTAIPIVVKTLEIPVQEPHYHANFAVFVDGKQVDFSSPRLMSIQPCSDDVHINADPLKNVHLHDQVGNVVHVHANGITWRHFFDSIAYDYLAATNEKTVSVYVDGTKQTPQVLLEEIVPQAKLLVHIASQSGAENVESDPQLVKEYEAVGNSATDYDTGKMGTELCGSSHQTRSPWQRFRIAFSL